MRKDLFEDIGLATSPQSRYISMSVRRSKETRGGISHLVAALASEVWQSRNLNSLNELVKAYLLAIMAN